MSLLKPQEKPNAEITGFELIDALYFLERVTLDSCHQWNAKELDSLRRNFDSLVKTIINKRI